MTEKQVMHEVKHQLTRHELLELGEELARATDDLREIERRKKEVMADLAADLKRADGRVSMFAGKIKDKWEWRTVQCIAAYGVPRAGQKTLRRLDTNEEIETLSMTESEMQACLDFGTTAEGTAENPPQ